MAGTLDRSVHAKANPLADVRGVKRVVGRLHAFLRDTDGGSTIVQRFDELTKLLFVGLVHQNNGRPVFFVDPGEDPSAYAARIRRLYSTLAQGHAHLIPDKFSRLLCSDAAIRGCGEILCSESAFCSNFDIKGLAYEETIRGTFDKSDHQQFFTPPHVVRFLVQLLTPFLHGTVADPACGTAGFLAEIARIHPLSVAKLVGMEIDDRLAWVSGMNLLLHGAREFETLCVSEGGSLGSQVESRFGIMDAIVTNPPFGSELSDEALLRRFELGRGRQSRRRGILFIERCWQLLKNEGVLGIVIDEGVLNLSSSTDVRQFILKNFDILAVVALPETTFMPYAAVNTSIMILRKTNQPRTSQMVFFGKAENVGRKASGDDDFVYDESGIACINSDFPELLRRWQKVQTSGACENDDMSFVANVSENLASDNTLRLDFRYHHPARNSSVQLLAHSAQRMMSLDEICDERIEMVVPARDMPDQMILYTGLAHIEAQSGRVQQVPTPAASVKSSVKRYEPNDVVFARMRPSLRKAALMAFSDGGFVSPECSVFSVKRDSSGYPILDPRLLAAMLRSDFVFGQLMHLISGIGRPRLNRSDLHSVRIPVPPIELQRECYAGLNGTLASAEELRAEAGAMFGRAKAMESDAVEKMVRNMIGS